MIKIGRRVGYMFFVALAFTWFLATPSEAVSCSVTGTSGGNPGGEPVYTCTDLVEGDSFTMTVDQTVTGDTLLATALITVVDIGDGTALIEIALSNDSGGANRITSFGRAVARADAERLAHLVGLARGVGLLGGAS